MTGPVCTYDFTCFDVDSNPKTLLKTYCKKWCYQLEKGEQTGRLHFQGRFSLKVKERINGVIKKFNGWHISITSGENRDNNFYVTKEETRIDGPWTDEDEEIYIPKDVRAITELRPWQKSMMDICKSYCVRTVNIIYDPVGNSGKTTATRYAMCNGYAQMIPFVNDFKDMMRMVMCMKPHKCYLIDMPRAINKERLYQLYSGIEMLKSGYCYDDRYKFKQRLFDPPGVIVFTNELPELNMLSGDRWKIWSIQDNKLIPYDETDFLGVAL